MTFTIENCTVYVVASNWCYGGVWDAPKFSNVKFPLLTYVSQPILNALRLRPKITRPHLIVPFGCGMIFRDQRCFLHGVPCPPFERTCFAVCLENGSVGYRHTSATSANDFCWTGARTSSSDPWLELHIGNFVEFVIYLLVSDKFSRSYKVGLSFILRLNYVNLTHKNWPRSRKSLIA